MPKYTKKHKYTRNNIPKKIKRLEIVYFLTTYFCLVSSRRDYIDGMYHDGISDFNFLVPHKSSIQGDFQTFHLNQYFNHDFIAQRIQKRSLNDTDNIHYGIWIGDNLKQLDLQPNRQFLNPRLVFETIDDKPINKREIRSLEDKKLCYYIGKVHGYEDSSAAISTCDGLVGNIRIKDKDYFIEPVKGHGPNEDGHHLHVVYDLTKKMYRKKRSNSRKSWCAVQDGDREWENGIGERIKDSILDEESEFDKRDINASNKTNTPIKPKFMETTMVCDKSFVDFHKGHRDLDVYMLTAANTAFNAFWDASFGSEMTLSLVRVVYLQKEEPGFDLNVSVSIDDTLDSFNAFAERINVPEDDPMHHDVAMLASRVDMCSGSNLTDCVVCGIAKIGGVCKTNYSANVAEDDGVYELAMTMTHEAGHLLGITHDGKEGLGQSCTNPTNTTGRPKAWIMSVVDANDVYLGWSQCSRAMSGSFIRNGWADCMNDKPEKTNKKYPNVPIGALYGRDEQCYLSTIRKGKKFVADKSCGDPSECENLYCQFPNPNKGCKTINHFVADGTPCGENKWCWNSKCVPKGNRPDSIDGGWSDWTGWTECSRTCGGGIQINKRTCDNPQQSGGGRYCQGDDQRTQLCNLEPCEVSARNKVCKRDFKGIALFLEKNPCQIACIASRDTILWSDINVPNGEACEWGQYPRKRCIFGECEKIGCDNVIGSDAIRDDCGICNGDSSSCTIVDGRWKQKNTNGARTQKITVFPKRAFNIRIVEMSTSSSKISLLDTNSKQVYLNDYEKNHSESSVQGPKKFSEGVEGYYSVNGLLENITIECPLKEELLFKVVYLADDADFKWTYSIMFGNETVAKEERNYRWEQNDWTECSKVCGGGIQTSTFICVEETLGKVSDDLCVGLDAPNADSKACREQPCATRWVVGQWGDCHTCCNKGGVRARGVECMQENPEKGGEDVLVADEDCGEPKPKSYAICSPKKTTKNPRKKRCTLGLPEKYMNEVWKQLGYF